MPFVTSSKTQPSYDVIIVGSGAAGGQSAYVLAAAGARILMLEAGRNYDPTTETPMFNLPYQAPLRATGTPDKSFGFYDATVNGGWTIANESYVVKRKGLINDTHVCNYIRPKHPMLNAFIYRSAFAVWLWREILYSNYGKENLFPWVGRHLPDLLLHQKGLVGTLITVPGVDPPERLGHPAYREEDVPERYHYMLGEENLAKHVGEFGETARQLNAKLLATGFIEKGQEEIFRRAGFDAYSFYDIFEGLDLRGDGGYSPSGTTDHFSEAGNEIIARKLAAYLAEQYL